MLRIRIVLVTFLVNFVPCPAYLTVWSFAGMFRGCSLKTLYSPNVLNIFCYLHIYFNDDYYY